MKKKNGFTLIELLAVIVILAIIALIAVPIIMNVINEAKKGAAKDSMYGYVEAIELEIAKAMLTDQNLLTGEYTTKTGDLYSGSTKALSVSFKGTKPDDNGTLTLTNGRVTKAELTFGGFAVTYDGKESNSSEDEKEEVLEKLCTKSSSVDLANLTYGNQFTCELGDGVNRTFYLLEQNGETVSFIMDSNMGSMVVGTNKNEYLKEQTSGWTKLKEGQVSLPTYNQIVTASNSSSNLASWLTVNLNRMPYGYWLTTDQVVRYYGGASLYNASSSDLYDVRPVITIVKGNLQ